MKEPLIELARRKERLIARIEGQRTTITAACAAWQRPIGVIDQGIAAVAYLRAHLELLALGAVVMIALKPRRLLRWIGSGMTIWRTWRALQAWARREGYR